EELDAIRVVHRTLELLVERDARGRVETPRRPVRDDHRVVSPLVQLLVEEVGRLGRLVAVGRQRLHVDAGRTERRRDDLLLQLAEIEIALAVEEIEERELEALRQRRPRGERLPER